MSKILGIGIMMLFVFAVVSCRKSRVKSNCCETYAQAASYDSGFVLVPNIIAPDGDGIYDFLVPNHEGLETIKFTVYDRKGNEVFNSTELIGDYWNGEVNGTLKSDIFTYTLTGTATSGEDVDISGEVCVVANNELDCIKDNNVCLFEGWVQDNSWGDGYFIYNDLSNAPFLNCE